MNIEQKQWLTGFFEGDGCAYSGEFAQLIFTQKFPDVLEYIQGLSGGRLYKRRYPQKIGIFTHYRLVISTNADKLALLRILATYVVSKPAVKRLRLFRDRLGISEKTIQIGMNDISKLWAVGFWDAEGSSVLNHKKTPAITFGVKNGELLDKLSEVFLGKRNDNGGMNYLYCRGNSARDYIDLILKYSHHRQKRDKLLNELIGYNSRFHNSKYGWCGKEEWVDYCSKVVMAYE